MSPAALDAALALCLGAGSVQLAALNLVVLPALRAPAEQPVIATPAPAPPAPVLHPELWSVQLAPGPDRLAQPVLVAVLEFDSASQRVTRRAQRVLRQTLAPLRGASEISVVGHADSSGPEQLNQRLSAERAAAVAERLIESGIDSARVHVEARGEREPRFDGSSRRVEVYAGAEP